MRLFTNEEQLLLRRINDGLGSNLYNLIDPWINDVTFEVNTDTNKVTFILETALTLEMLEKVERIQLIVIQAVNLIKLFEDRGYIITYRRAHQIDNPYIFGQLADVSSTTRYEFPDIRISKLFTEYSINEIFVTPELGRFINNGFITREAFRANRQFWATLTAIVIAFLGVLINLGFNIYKFQSEKSEKEVINLKNSTIDSTNIRKDTIIRMDSLIGPNETNKKHE